MDNLSSFRSYADHRWTPSGIGGYAVGIVYREESTFMTNSKKPVLKPFLEIDKTLPPSRRLEAARRISHIEGLVRLVKDLESADINLESLYRLKLEAKNLLDLVLARDTDRALKDFYLVEAEEKRIKKEKEERQAAQEKAAREQAEKIRLSCEFVKNGGGESCEDLFSDSFESNACQSCKTLTGV